MSEDARAELQRRLGRDAPGLASLPEADAVKLLALLQSARQRQRDAVVAAQQHALRFVPAVLRKPLLKLLAD